MQAKNLSEKVHDLLASHYEHLVFERSNGAKKGVSILRPNTEILQRQGIFESGNTIVELTPMVITAEMDAFKEKIRPVLAMLEKENIKYSVHWGVISDYF